MSQKDYKTMLGFTDQWLTLGLVTEESLHQSGTFYETGIDRSTEHYRYGAFRRYLEIHRPLSASMVEALYELGAADADSMMGGAMMADIVALAECPTSVTAQALNSGRQHLIRLVERQRILREWQTEAMTPERFQLLLESSNSTIQRTVLETEALSPEQTQMLAEQGASRTVRNIAKNGLRQRKNWQAPEHQ